MLAHEPFYSSPPDVFAGPAQLGMNARTSIGSMASFMDTADLRDELAVLQASSTGRSTSPSVIAGSAHAIEPTHHPDRLLFFAVIDEGEDLGFRAEVKAMAFFKRSCSTFNRS